MSEGSGTAKRGSASPFVGRRPDLAALEGVVGETAAGRGQVVVVGGEPGIGKTRLVQELGARAEERGATVLWSSCWEGAPALWPWAAALRRLVGNDPSLP
ncbi:MAG: AAA family ATPase, partial [Acidimicrobiia bacterium]